MAQKAKLNAATATDYVTGYYESVETVSDVKITEANPEYVCDGLGGSNRVFRVVATFYDAADNRRHCIAWDVFTEDDGDGGTCIRGEF